MSQLRLPAFRLLRALLHIFLHAAFSAPWYLRPRRPEVRGDAAPFLFLPLRYMITWDFPFFLLLPLFLLLFFFIFATHDIFMIFPPLQRSIHSACFLLFKIFEIERHIHIAACRFSSRCSLFFEFSSAFPQHSLLLRFLQRLPPPRHILRRHYTTPFVFLLFFFYIFFTIRDVAAFLFCAFPPVDCIDR